MELNIDDIIADLQRPDTKPSISYIVKRWKIVPAFAFEIIRALEKQGVITAPDYQGQRQLITKQSEAR